MMISERFDATVEEWLRGKPSQFSLAKLLVFVAYQLLIAQSLLKLTVNNLDIRTVGLKRLPEAKSWTFELKQTPSLFRYEVRAQSWVYFLNLMYAVVQIRPQRFLTTPVRACVVGKWLRLFNPSHDLRMFVASLYHYLHSTADDHYRKQVSVVYRHLRERLQRNGLPVRTKDGTPQFKEPLRNVVTADFVPRTFLHEFQTVWERVQETT